MYALLAVGLVLSFSTSRVFNFGHAAVAFSSAFVFYQVNSGLGWPVAVSAVFVICVFAPAFGFIWDRLVFRRLADAPDAVKLVASVGVLLVMPALVELVVDILKTTAGLHLLDWKFTVQTPGVGPKVARQWHLMSGVTLSSDQLIALGAGLLLFAALWAVLRLTRYGLIVRTAVDRPALASLRGTRTAHVSAVVWVVSFMFAAVVGVVAGPITGFGVVANNYTVALFVAATAAVLARLRSIPIAFACGLGLGALTNLALGYLNSTYLGPVGQWIQSVHGLQASVPYAALLVGLVILGADRRRATGTVAEVAAPLDYYGHLSRWRRRLPWVIGTVVLVAYSMGPIGVIWRRAMELALATALVFLSYTLVTGIGGMISLAQTAFVTASGLALGYLMDHHGWPFLAAAAVAIVIAGLLGVVVALPALRLGGIALALATLALALLGNSVLFQIGSLGNFSQGWVIKRPKLGILDLSHDRVATGVLLVLVLLTIWLITNLARSATGRAVMAVRSSQPAAAASGVPPTATKLIIFGLSAVVAGLGGVMLAVAQGSVNADSYAPNPLSFLWLAMVVVWGIRRPGAAVTAGVSAVLLPRILNNGIHVGHVGWGGTSQTLIPQILFGLGAIALAKTPDGVLAQMAEQRHRKRTRRDNTDTRSVLSAAPTGAETPRDGALLPMSVPSNGLGVHSIGNGEQCPLMVLSDVHAGYGPAEVLHGIDLAISKGGITAIVGPNGAGKSTLCSVMSGLVQLSRGSIRFRDEDVSRLGPAERYRLGIAAVPESRGIFPSLSVEENLAFALPKRDDRLLVYERFPQLASRRRIAAGNLSGGEQQMLSVGPMLVRPPVLLLLDEPTLGLAEVLARDVLATIEEIALGGTTVVVVEEKARATLEVADTVAILYNGTLRLVAPRAELDISVLEQAYTGERVSAL
jgi:ABC-type branched-subunit amino acid transport system ATPase component/branched-subunit amino acid ABC-type transport system permease component